MIHENFIWLIIPISLAGCISYSYQIFNGKVQPNLVSWVLWTAIPFIAFFIQLDENVGLSSMQTLMVGVSPLIVVISALIAKKSIWKISSLDIVVGGVSIIATIFWLIFDSGLLGVALAIAADLLAGIPTVIKSYKHPETESTAVVRNGVITSIVAMMTIKNWNFVTYGFTLYIFLFCLIMYFIIKYKIGLRFSKTSHI